jgi:hypothetical protein
LKKYYKFQLWKTTGTFNVLTEDEFWVEFVHLSRRGRWQRRVSKGPLERGKLDEPRTSQKRKVTIFFLGR